MTDIVSNLTGFTRARVLVTALAATIVTAPVSAHEQRYLYHAQVNNKYDGEGPKTDSKELFGDSPLSASVEGVWAFANNDHGGTVYAAAEVPPINPFALTNLKNAGGSGYLSYNVWIDGPDPDALVPVRFIANGTVTSNYDRASGEALLRFNSTGVYDGPDALYQEWDVVGAANPDDLTGVERVVAFFEVDKIYNLKPSITYHIEMLASAGAGDSGRQGSRATARVDPVFTILGDYASTYRMMGVPGGGSVPGGAVPEPASWALMMAGFGLIGASMRRQGLRVAHSMN